MSTEATQWSKFKTCADLRFCRKHRFLIPKPEDSYAVLPESIALVNRNGKTAINGHLQRQSGTDDQLQFTVTAINPGIFRLSIASLKPEIHVRYQVNDVLVDDLKYIDIPAEALSRAADHALLTIGSNALKISYNPFNVQLLDPAAHSEPALLNINEGSRLFYEIHRHKPTPSPPPSPSPVPSPTEADPGANAEDEGSEMAHEEHQAETGQEAAQTGWGETFQSFHDSQKRGPESVGTDISFPFAEHLHGLPGRTVADSLPLTKDAQGNALTEPYRMYNLDVFEFELDKPFGLYGAVPLIMGRKKEKSAAVMWLNAAETYVDVTARHLGGLSSHWYSESGAMDIFLLSGPNPNNIFSQYRALTGPATMPQRFSLGYHQCRWNYRDDQDVRTVDAGFEKHDIPYDVMWLDIEHTDGKRYFTWDMSKFPDPTKLQNDLAARGRKMVTIIDPHIKRDNKFKLHRFAMERKHYVMKDNGKPYDGWCWPGAVSYFDFSSPIVRQAWASRFNPTDYPHFTNHLYTWVDMNEPSVFNGPEGTMQKDLVHHENVEHRHLHNIYGHYVQRATFEGLLQGHGGNDRPFVLSRSYFAGSQRYGAIWTGDNTASWEHLASTVRTLIPLQITGQIFSGADVGGFFGNPSAELLLRWYQAGAFQPFFRAHGHLDTDRREPWLFGEETTAMIASAIRTRYTFLPFWYTLFAGNALADVHPFSDSARGPPMRPVWWEFPNDSKAEGQTLQWTGGSALLAAPVLEANAATKDVYLPADEVWYDLFDTATPGKPISGGQSINLATPLDRMIVFQRGGTIIPKQERRRRSSAAMKTDPVTLVVAPNVAGEATGELYLDDGKSYDYKSGAFTLVKFRFSKKSGLEATIVAGGKTKFVGSDIAVERVVVFGLNKGEVQAMAVDNRAVEFEHSFDGHSTIIRQPKVACNTNWSIMFS